VHVHPGLAHTRSTPRFIKEYWLSALPSQVIVTLGEWGVCDGAHRLIVMKNSRGSQGEASSCLSSASEIESAGQPPQSNLAMSVIGILRQLLAWQPL